MKLAIIIVNYNTKDFLDKCISSIYKNTLNKVNYKIIVVDNCSKDNTVEFLREKYTKVKWINLKRNVGFSRANNIGVGKAGEPDYIFFLNPDTLLERKTLEKLLYFMEKNIKVGVVTPYLKLLSGEIDDACHRGFPTLWNSFCYFIGLSKVFPSSNLFNGYHLGYKNLSKPHEIDSCAGAAMFVRYETGTKIGWWDEEYFWYGEDIDFCYRAKKAGWKVVFYPKAKILHYKGVSGGIKKNSRQISIADEKTRKLAQKARFEAMELFYRKHYMRKYPRAVNWSVLFFIRIFKLVKTILS